MNLFLIQALFLFGGNLEANLNQPLPDSVWQVKTNAEKGIFDAVVIEDTTQFTAVLINRHRIVRIFSEAGKAAAAFEDTSGTAKNVKGRVVDVNGQSTQFDGREDLVESLSYKRRGDRQKSRIMVPPGLSTDCVVEISWSVAAEDGLPKDSWQETFYARGPYYCLERTFIISKTAMKQTSNGLPTQFIWTESDDASFKVTKKRGDTIVSYFNQEPLIDHPFDAPLAAGDLKFLLGFKTFQNYPRDPKGFWKDISSDYLKNYVYDYQFSRPGDYKDWIAELRKHMKGDAAADMTLLTRAFRKRMISQRLATSAQALQIGDGMTGKEDPDKLLGRAWKRGYGNTWELGMLFYYAAMDCGLPFHLVFSNSIFHDRFDPRAMLPFGLNYRYPYFGVQRSNGSWAFFAPQWYEYDGGYIPAREQGTTAFLVEPGSWNYQFITLPLYGAPAHQVVSRWQTGIDANGEIQMTLNRQFTGMNAASIRRNYLPLSAEERQQTLANNWERVLEDWEVVQAYMSGVDAPDQPPVLDLALKGSMDKKINKAFFAPFPGYTWLPLSAPDYWPPNRSTPIAIDKPATVIDVNQITLPPDARLLGDPNWKRVNRIGEVAFGAQQDGNSLIVRRDIILKSPRAGADLENDLKAFIAWMDEAYRQSIAIEFGGNP